MDEAKETGNAEDIEKQAKRTIRVGAKENEECKRLLRLMGVPVVEVCCCGDGVHMEIFLRFCCVSMGVSSCSVQKKKSCLQRKDIYIDPSVRALVCSFHSLFLSIYLFLTVLVFKLLDSYTL